MGGGRHTPGVTSSVGGLSLPQPSLSAVSVHLGDAPRPEAAGPAPALRAPPRRCALRSRLWEPKATGLASLSLSLRPLRALPLTWGRPRSPSPPQQREVTPHREPAVAPPAPL